MKKTKGGVTAPKGFKAAGVACGIKKSGKLDLALISSEVPAIAAGVFTTNQVKAAPVLASLKQLKSGISQAIIANAGNANCWTGGQGMQDAWEMIYKTAVALGISPRNVLVTSTGVIGKALPMPKVCSGIKKVAKKLSKVGGSSAARAILTTDTRPKEIAVKVGNITIAGMAKGSGMLAPGMATMHAFITTDAKVEKRLLQKILKQAVDKSFNMISVDNCMSTNDCVIALANGLAGSVSPSKFQKAFEFVCEYLAKELAWDGEGASKLLTIKVSGAKSAQDARVAAKALINSFLLKSAVYGRDKNTGRILQAIGATSVTVNWDKFKFDWKMGSKEDTIKVNLGAGKAASTGWGCDLTEGYVKVNARYKT